MTIIIILDSKESYDRIVLLMTSMLMLIAALLR